MLLLGIVTLWLVPDLLEHQNRASIERRVAEKEVISQPIAIFAGCCIPVNIYFYYLAGKEGLHKKCMKNW